MSKSKAYRATNVNEVRIEELTRIAAGRPASVGMDIGKHEIFSVVRWQNGEFERPWKVKNPAEIPLLAERLRSLAEHCALTVAMEPTGT